MKLHSKLTLIGSIAALATSPLALAGKGAGAAKPEPAEVEETSPEIIICPGPAGDGDTGKPDVVLDDIENPKGGDDTEAVNDDETVTDIEDGGSEPDGGEVVDGGEVEDGGTVPIDWVKRGDAGDHPELMFATGGVEAPVFKGDTAAKDLGQDEKAADIEATDAPVAAPVQKEKKAPVALIKKGRVFLR